MRPFVFSMPKAIEQRRDDGEFEQILAKNDGLIGMVVGWFSASRADQEDLFQAGVIGLWNATRWFDSNKGTWSTYAAKHILAQVSRASEFGDRTARVPTTALRRIRKIHTTQATLLQELMRDPTEDEIAGVMDGESKESVQFLLQSERRAVSLDQPLFDWNKDEGLEGRTMHDVFPSAIKVEDEVELRLLRELVGDVLEEAPLTPRQRKVINLRFGIIDRSSNHTLEEIGKKHGVTREAVRQQEKKAFEWLRTESLLRRLFEEHEW